MGTRLISRNPLVVPLPSPPSGGGSGTVNAYNGFAAVTWTVPANITQASAVLTASAAGQTTVTSSVTGPGTTAYLGLNAAQVDPINYATGNPLSWAFQVDVVDPSGTHHPINLGNVTPSIIKPSSAITGPASGADARPNAGALTSITGANFINLVTGDGQTFTNYDITSGFTLYHGSVAAPITFKNCVIEGVMNLKGGGTARTAVFIDCKFKLPPNSSTGCFTAPSSPQTMIRCELVGGADQNQQFQTGSRFKHLYMHGQAPAAGSHADFMQLTSGQQDVWWVGCFYDASDADTSLSGINSVFQGGTWSTLGERMQVVWDHCWINGSTPGHYVWSGVVPNGTQNGDVQFRNCKFGLHIDKIWYPSSGTDGVNPGTAYTNGQLVFGDSNTWETTGTTLSGLSVVAGALFPKPA